jgi:hypothetical protein
MNTFEQRKPKESVQITAAHQSRYDINVEMGLQLTSSVNFSNFNHSN